MEKTNIQVNFEEEYSQKPIPQSMRKHWFYAASVYIGMCAVLAGSMAGGGLIYGLALWQAITAMFLGLVALLVLFYIPLGKIGAEQGLNTYLIGECAFGKRGSDIATSFIVTVIPCVAWYGIEVSIATQAMAAVIPMSKTVFNIVTLIFGVVFAIPAMYGIISMAWLNWVSLPIMIYIIIFGVGKAIMGTGIGSLWAYNPQQNMGLMWGINMQIGMIAVGCSFVADYTRWIKNKWSDMTYSGIVGLFPATSVLTIAGMIMALSATKLGVKEPWNIVEVMIKLGMPAMALVFVFLLQWTTCITSAYSSGLALKKVFGGSRFYLTLISALVGTAFAISGIVSYFLNFVSILASWVTPVAGVIITEYFFVSRKRFIQKEGIYWPGLISVLIGGLISWKIKFFIPAVNGMIIGGLIYYVYHKALGLCVAPETGRLSSV
ncbi:purine-cytosine permease family protein [Thermoanaerobacterium sp. DL9XJH110]|uniref:purine-cytosine permease family protein n=1 Tax=Thermoanaerobacterium sp. DL9XJH110 TaxID=3386643 RepID=UPI003BB61A47